ncbi:AlkA N-terminal domain-containing protein [Lysinibacter sp. HNR]|uniref:DNA-3-methyladenine glycosylase family protein n=1 Tax=Lysinibacter sp. HNR TaxID=3031408 RepID=UPI00243542C4|nr:AlkA N-terminal domain-containing protein [Lysinibacter sp. HNR]WGD36540.1 AlkA N-terminal domain-containing protein [Lysinibacter sp. HNR]
MKIERFMQKLHSEKISPTSGIRLNAAQPFHHNTAFAVLQAHAIPGAERTDHDILTHTRVFRTANGPSVVTIAFDTEGVRVHLDTRDQATTEILQRVQAWLGLNTDTTQIDQALSRDTLLAPLVTQRPGIRLIGYPEEFEAVATTVIGQQVSLAAVLAQQDVNELQQCTGLTRARTKTLHTVATHWADGDLLTGLAPEEARRMLLAIPGIGPWTTDYLLVRALQHPDTFALGDLVARRALGLNHREAERRSHDWAPYRSYALLHLWAEAAYFPAPRDTP